MTGPASVEGAYGATPLRARWWVALAVVWFLLALGWGFIERDWWMAALYLVIAVGAAFVAWAARRRTVVAPEGVRSRRGVRWPLVPWAAVEAVTPAPRWTSPPTLRVRSADGREVVTDVPNDRYAAFLAYAVEHGANPSLGDRPGGTPSGEADPAGAG